MAGIIADLTDYTRTRASGVVSLDREKLDLGELVAEIAREIPVKPGRDLRLRRVGDGTGEWDRGRLLRVIVNLVNNAFAYGAPGSPVTVDVEGEDGCVSLRVQNEGEPIAADLLPHLFEPFKRGRKGAGAGLGLYIVRQIAHAHGGSIEVQSNGGRGTTFLVRLPRQLVGDAH